MFRAFRYMNLFSVGEMNNLIHALDEVKLEPRYYITGQCLKTMFSSKIQRGIHT